jgi:hypothetical protein
LFTPWVGSKYRNDNYFGSARVLLVGESHYDQNPETIGTTPADFTTTMMQRYPLSGAYNPFFCNVMRAVMGLEKSDPWKPAADHFWNSLAFYNYVPVVVDGRVHSEGGSERRPDERMFRAGAKPFRQVLARLEPQAVIVCGLELWDWLAPNLDGFDGPPRDVIFYDDGRSVFTRIHHPSYRRFDPFHWHMRIKCLLEMTADPRQSGRKVTWQMIQASQRTGVEDEPT